LLTVILTKHARWQGCDIPNVKTVVQFLVLKSLSIWLQRAGRAGCARGSQATAYLLVQPSVFQEKGKAKRLPGDDVQYVKGIEEGLRRWIEVTDSCCQNVADDYFFNPPH